MSDDGSDDNDCHSVSTPCRNLQTVLDRARDGADIYVTSNTLSLDFVIMEVRYTTGIFITERDTCVINSSLSYTLRSYHNATIKVTCPRMFYYLLVLYFANSLHDSSHEFYSSCFVIIFSGIMTELNYFY